MNVQTTFRVLAGGTVAAAACLLTAGCGRLAPSNSTSSQTGGSAAVDQALAPPSAAPPKSGDTSAAAGTNFVRGIASKIKPAVVTVHTLAAIQRQPMSMQDLMFGRGGGRPEIRQGAGSGVLISPDGYIITNNHVVAGAQQVTVMVGDTGYRASVVGADALTDIAVVKITPPSGKTFPVAQLGDSDTVQVGDWAVAVGDPLDIGSTVTFGIISAIGERGPRLQGDSASNVLQTDAAINPGNSGGALANSDGQVIGINEAIASPTGSSIGIGFAIPINAARDVAKQLIASGRVIRPYLGISYQPVKSVPPPVRAQAGIDPNLTTGLIVAQVAPGTPAAGVLRPGDVLLSVDGKALDGTDTLSKTVAAHKVGDAVKIEVQRGTQKSTVSVTLRERPAAYGIRPNGQQP